MSKKNKIIFGAIIIVTMIVLGLCVYSIEENDKNIKKISNNSSEIEVCTKDGC